MEEGREDGSSEPSAADPTKVKDADSIKSSFSARSSRAAKIVAGMEGASKVITCVLACSRSGGMAIVASMRLCSIRDSLGGALSKCGRALHTH